jgi:hypothetical protein
MLSAERVAQLTHSEGDRCGAEIQSPLVSEVGPPTAQIPIAEHVARRGPPNAPKSRFRPLEVFVRRPPASVARFEPAGSETLTEGDICAAANSTTIRSLHRIGTQPICLCHFAVLGSEQLKAEIGEHVHLGRPVPARGEDGVEREKLSSISCPL